MAREASLLVLVACIPSAAGYHLFHRPIVSTRVTLTSIRAAHVPQTEEVVEPAAIATLDALQAQMLQLPQHLSSGPVECTFASTGVAPSSRPPVVLLHGFDSSCVEFRRLLPLLAAEGIEAYALDLIGWGFSSTANARDVGVEVKREHLFAFWQTVCGGRKMVLGGTSLGAAVLIDFFAEHADAVSSTILIDPQGFIDGAPPVPGPLARVGIRVLESWPLRWFANQLAYYDKRAMATDDAIRVGLLHVSREGWEDDQVQWLLGGGYSVSELVPRLSEAPCLLLWGRQDEILPASDYLSQFVSAIPEAQFRWVEECGHVPHLEKPGFTAAAIAAFVQGEAVPLAAEHAAKANA